MSAEQATAGKVTKAASPSEPGVAKFVQISSGQPFGQGLTLFALDEAGVVWQHILGREPDAWAPLTQKRHGSPASR